MTFLDLHEGVAGLFGEWSPDAESVSFTIYQRRLAEQLERQRAWFAWKMKTSAAFRQKRRAYNRASWSRMPAEARRARGARRWRQLKADPAKLAARYARDIQRQRARGPHGRPVSCACGCGASMPERSTFGYARRFVRGHNGRHGGATQSALLALLSERPRTMRELASLTGKTLATVSAALAGLRSSGVVAKPARKGGAWRLA